MLCEIHNVYKEGMIVIIMEENTLEILRNVGLEEKEGKIYIALLKLGSSSASTIGTHLGYDRTTTYYLLLKMSDKGYVTKKIEGGVKQFTAAHPNEILLRCEQKGEQLKNILPSLQQMMKIEPEELKVEVLKGVEGLHLFYRDILRTGGEVLIFGVDEEQFMKFDELHLNQYFKQSKKIGVKERVLTFEGAKCYGPGEYRFIPKGYFQPNMVTLYGNKVVFILWEPQIHLIMIESKELAQSFKTHFELLWTIAKKK